MWTIAKQTSDGRLTIVCNGQMWVYQMTALRHSNMMCSASQKKCQVVEVPASLKGDLHGLLMFLHEDAETRKEILTD
jgi:hypothetical protein